MKYNGQNIITDDDVTLTAGRYEGEKLSHVLGELTDKTDKMLSNIKWIYKYGGVGGTGGGSGSGGSSTGEYSIYASLSGVQLNSLIIPVESGESLTLLVRISKPGGATYYVSYSYTVKENNKIRTILRSVELNLQNNYEFTVNLTLNCNGIIRVTARDSINNDTKQIEALYITDPYTFTSSLKIGEETQQSELFISEASGLTYQVNYDIAIVATIEYQICIHLNGSYGDVYSELTTLPNKSGTLIFNFEELASLTGWTLSEANAGSYTIEFLATITQSGLSTSYKHSTTFNLVPRTLYLAVTPGWGHIYGTDLIPEDDFFNMGSAIPFYIKPYQGYYQSNAVIIYYKFNDGEELSISGSLRQLTTITFTPRTEGIHKFSVRASCQSEHYPKTGYVDYYFRVVKSQTALDWYKEGREVRRLYFLGSDQDDSHVFQPLVTASGGNAYNNTINNKSLQISGLYNPSSLKDRDLLISFGIMYNELGDDDTVLLKFYNSQNKELISLTQNLITIGNSSIKYYLPKKTPSEMNEVNPNYTLVDLLFRLVKTSGTDYYYEVMVYIDGVPDGSLQNYITTVQPIDHFTIFPSNTSYNFFEISYPMVLPGNTPEDIEIFRHKLMYQLSCGKTPSDSDIQLLDCMGVMILDNNGDSYCEETTVLNIAQSVNVPVLLLSIEDNDRTAKIRLEQGYNEGEVLPKFQTSVKWYKNGSGANDLTSIIPPPTFSAANFYIEPQGSSTLKYKNKNYTLSLETTDESVSDIYLFSPNFKNCSSKEEIGEQVIFLPELEFILKADVVDSSHSNNTALGKFINDVTNPFITDVKGSHYIKNCLEGFPVLVFIQFVKSDEDKKCYFQGIYNFNLGRTSYYNLGYKSLDAFYNGNTCLIENANNGFTFIAVDGNTNNYKPGLLVTEVQGNSHYFDFSQYDKSILFKQTPSDVFYMFDDIVTGLDDNVKVQDTIQNFVRHTSLAGGYIFEHLLKKRLSSTDSDMYGYLQGYSAQNDNGISLNLVPNYKYQLRRDPTYDTFSRVNNTLLTSLANDLISYVLELEENNGIYPYIDYQSLSEYYTICMAFGLVDSVLKNLNIKTWSADRDYTTWVCAFYDMDTWGGINNAGYDTDYRAFSDYWLTNDKIDDDESIILPQEAVIYRDFSPVGQGIDTSGYYDTPSSYLFAIAKYALLESSISKDGKTILSSPQALWAKWRLKGSVLESADRFLKTYYNNNIGIIASPLICLNYRNKYFYIENSSDNSFRNIDWEKFNGTRLNKLRNWLSNRFHLMDGYMNITKHHDYIKYYDSTGKYVNLVDDNGLAIELPTYEQGQELIKNNSDVVVFQDVFSKNTSQQGTDSFSVKIKTKSLLPVYVDTANKQSITYLLEPDKLYKLSVELNGMQTYSIGGSPNFVYIDRIDDYAQGQLTLNITSEYLENLSGYGNRPLLIGTSSVNLKAVKDIALVGENYSGNLRISSGDLRNLNSLNTSYSRIDLDIDQSTCTRFDISHMHSDHVYITNCELIKSITFGSSTIKDAATTIDKCNISPIGSNIATTGDLLSGGLEIGGASIRELTLTNNVASDPGKYTRISIVNNPTLETVTLHGFSSVLIANCPKLSNITISNDDNSGDKLQSLIFNEIGNEAESLTLNKTELSIDGIIDLNEFKELIYLRINGCDKLEYIKVPNEDITINLGYYAFADNKNLKAIVIPNIEEEFITTLNIIGSNVFSNCPKFSLKYNDTDRINLKIDRDCGDIRELFRSLYSKGSLTREDVQWFIANAIEEDNQITNINALFEGQDISINLENYTNYLSNREDNYSLIIDMSKFHKVIEVGSCFKSTNINVWYPELFNFGSDVESTIFSYQYVPNNGRAQVTVDVFKYVYYKLADFHVTVGTLEMNIIDENGQSYGYSISDCVKLVDLFYPIKYLEEGIEPHDPMVITNLSSIDIYNYSINFEDFFKTFSKITSISNFMTSNKNLENMFNFAEEGYLTKLTGLLYMSNSFCFTNISNPVPLKDFCNWKALSGNPFKKEVLGSLETEEALDFGLYKYITIEDLNELGTILLTNSFEIDGEIKTRLLTGLSNLFRRCFIIDPTGTPIKFERPIGEDGEPLSNNIQNLSNLFAECYRRESLNGSNLPLIIDPDFFDTFPNVTILNGTFRNTTLANSLPDNFFKKKTETGYNKVITDLRYCFYNTRWAEGLNHYNGDIYYSDTADENHLLNHPSRLPSSEIKAMTFDPTFMILGETNLEVITLNNFILNERGSGNYLILPPDIIKGITSDCRLENCFAVSSTTEDHLEGILPLGLTDLITAFNKIDNLFNGLNIYPYHAINRVNEDNEVIEHIYCYIPENFFKLMSYTKSEFGFNLNVDNSNKEIPDKVYLLSLLSIPATTLMINYQAFPKTINETNFIESLNSTTSHNTDFKIKYNLMINLDTLEEGINLEYFNQIYLGRIVNPVLGQLLSGYLFTPGTTWSDIISRHQANVTQELIDLGRFSSISKNCIIPGIVSGVSYRNYRLMTWGSFDDMSLNFPVYQSLVDGCNSSSLNDFKAGYATIFRVSQNSDTTSNRDTTHVVIVED